MPGPDRASKRKKTPGQAGCDVTKILCKSDCNRPTVFLRAAQYAARRSVGKAERCVALETPETDFRFGMPLGAVARGDWGLENMTKFYAKVTAAGHFCIKFCQDENFYYLCTPYVE